MSVSVHVLQHVCANAFVAHHPPLRVASQMVGAVSDLLVYLPAEAPGLAGLLDTVQGRLR